MNILLAIRSEASLVDPTVLVIEVEEGIATFCLNFGRPLIMGLITSTSNAFNISFEYSPISAAALTEPSSTLRKSSSICV